MILTRKENKSTFVLKRFTIFIFLLISTFILVLLVKLRNMKYENVNTNSNPILLKFNKVRTHGKWISGKKSKFTCKINHTHGCCGNNTQKMHFQFADKLLNYNVKSSITQKIYKKNITILGDSLQLLFFEGLSEILELSDQKSFITSFKSYKKTPPWYMHKHKSNGWLQYIYFYYFSNQGKGCSTRQFDNKAHFVVNENILKSIINRSDIIVANLGLHYYFCTVGHYEEALRLFSQLLKEEIKLHDWKQIVYRATLPQHFYSKSNTGFFQKFNPNSSCAKVTSVVENPTNALLKAAAERYGFKYLDNYYIYKDRYDLHSRIKIGDCTHYCYSPELLVPELILLDQHIL